MCAKSLSSYLTLCNPMDCSMPGSSVHGILQAQILEWVACHPQGSSPQCFSLLHSQGGSLQLTPPGKPNIGVYMSFSIMVFSGYMPSRGIVGSYDSFRSFSGGASGKEPTCQCRRWGDVSSIPGLGRSLEKGMATHSSILAWRIPWKEGYSP